MKYSVKLIIRHTVETGEVFIEESIIMTEAGSFEEAYSKAREYVKENEIRAAYKNTFGRQVKSEVVSFADCFSVYDDEEVIEVYSSIIKTGGELPADTVVSVLEESCTREDLLPLRQWPDPDCAGEQPAAKAVFESSSILYTELSEALVSDYLAMVNDIEHVARLIGPRREPISEEKEISWVRKKLEEGAHVFSMLEKETGEFIGNIELMDLEGGSGELGIAITHAKQEKGYGTEAIPAVCEYWAAELGLERITLKVYLDNARAIHVYEKCGFSEYGRNEKEIFMERKA